MRNKINTKNAESSKILETLESRSILPNALKLYFKETLRRLDNSDYSQIQFESVLIILDCNFFSVVESSFNFGMSVILTL